MKKVLVVDDNHDAATMLAVMLELWECEPQVVNDGPAAIDAVRGSRFDLALVDIGLPGIDGWEVGRELHRLDPDLRLVALTGHAGDSHERQSIDAGFAAHLVKPVDMDVLEAEVRRAPTRESTSTRTP
jgi:CheY-like chemotaxis protein